MVADLFVATPNSEPVVEARPASRLQLGPIKWLHRHDGYISFAVRGEDASDWRQIRSIRATALDEWFPEFTQQLLRNSMVSINASYRLANFSTDQPHGLTAHRKDTLRYLCAAYCDLDYYTLNLKAHQVIGELARMAEAGEIPQYSLHIDSGKGMWLLWQLNDEEDPSQAHRGAFDDNPNDHLQLYVKINRELARRLAHLGSDSSPSASSHLRVPGSFRNDTEKYVVWTAHGNSERPYSYTLKELADSLGNIRLRERPKVERSAIEASGRPRGQCNKGWICSNQNRLTVIATIIDVRGGGFAEGCRNNGAFYYALALKGNGESADRALVAVSAMGKECVPPLSAGECRRAVRQAYKGKKSVRLHYRTLADALDVLPEEAEIVAQKIGKDFPAASRFGDFVAVTKISGEEKRETKRFERHQAIRELVEESKKSANGTVPSFRAMAALLRDRIGADVSYVTVRSDYASLGIVSSWLRVPPATSGMFDFHFQQSSAAA